MYINENLRANENQWNKKLLSRYSKKYQKRISATCQRTNINLEGTGKPINLTA